MIILPPAYYRAFVNQPLLIQFSVKLLLLVILACWGKTGSYWGARLFSHRSQGVAVSFLLDRNYYLHVKIFTIIPTKLPICPPNRWLQVSAGTISREEEKNCIVAENWLLKSALWEQPPVISQTLGVRTNYISQLFQERALDHEMIDSQGGA